MVHHKELKVRFSNVLSKLRTRTLAVNLFIKVFENHYTAVK